MSSAHAFHAPRVAFPPRQLASGALATRPVRRDRRPGADSGPLPKNDARGDARVAKLPASIDKIPLRRVKLYCALPYSEATQTLFSANGTEIEAVNGGLGLAGVAFLALMMQMGKSISASALQGGLDEKHTPEPLFGQDEWVAGSGGWNARDGG